MGRKRNTKKSTAQSSPAAAAVSIEENFGHGANCGEVPGQHVAAQEVVSRAHAEKGPLGDGSTTIGKIASPLQHQPQEQQPKPSGHTGAVGNLLEGEFSQLALRDGAVGESWIRTENDRQICGE
jgi:hypothetical protein